MKMTDEEILASWGKALDKKKHVQILADQNGVGVWDMMLKLDELTAPDLDRRWYQNLNPARKQQNPPAKNTGESKSSGEKVAYLRKIIEEQDRQLKERVAQVEALQKTISDMQGEHTELIEAFEAARGKADAQEVTEDICKRQQDEIDRLSGKLLDSGNRVESLERQNDLLRRNLSEANACLREQEDTIEALRIQRPTYNKFSLIRYFCDGLAGGGAFLMGRIVELLLDWRATGDASEFREYLTEQLENE